MRRALLVAVTLGCAMPAFAGEGDPLDALRLEDLSATRDRPLFAPTRRPPPPVRTDAAPPPEPAPVAEIATVLEPPPFDLVGAVVGEGTAFALLRDRATGKVVRLRSGDDAEGWRVGAIGLRSVALEHDARRETLALAAQQPVAVGAEVAGEPGPAAPGPLRTPKQP
jgi:hypothetical protein